MWIANSQKWIWWVQNKGGGGGREHIAVLVTIAEGRGGSGRGLERKKRR